MENYKNCIFLKRRKKIIERNKETNIFIVYLHRFFYFLNLVRKVFLNTTNFTSCVLCEKEKFIFYFC